MPSESAFVLFMMPRKPPRTMTNRQTSIASAKPFAGAMRKSESEAPVTSVVIPETMTVMTHTIASRMKMMENEVSIPLFFLPWA